MPNLRPSGRRPERPAGFLRSLRRNKYFWLASGLFGGVLVAGILALVLNYVIQPLSTPETWGYETVKTGDFHVWFTEESPSLANQQEIIAELDAEFADLLGLLHVERSDLDLPIDVFIHDSIPAMQTSIARRKSASASTYFLSVLDILAGDPVRPWLVEALLSQGWGHCYSQAIYLGTLLYLSNPNPEYLCTVAAHRRSFATAWPILSHRRMKPGIHAPHTSSSGTHPLSGLSFPWRTGTRCGSSQTT